MNIGQSRLTGTRRRKNDDDAVMPLINIVFLLLIFFMIAGKLSSADPFEISPPSSTSAENEETGSVTLLVGPDGELALDGNVLDRADLEATLSAKLRESPGTTLHLKADGESKAGAVIEVMEIIRDAGAGEIDLLTLQEEG